MTDLRDDILAFLEKTTEPTVDGEGNIQAAVWSSRNRLYAEFADDTQGVTRDDVDDAVEALESDDALLVWHGLITVADTPRLETVIENETQSRLTRKILVGKCNRLLGAG